jgi:DNA repair protein RadC
VTATLLLQEFGSFAAVLDGSTARLRRAGADDRAINALRWCRNAVLLSLRRRAVEQPMIGTSSALRDYLRVDMGTGSRERLRTLHLNARNELLSDDETSIGTIDAAPFYPREIIGRAIDVGASSIILVHNHPSGDPRPTPCDVKATVALERLCVGLDITLLDHLVVGRHEILSLRSLGLLSR